MAKSDSSPSTEAQLILILDDDVTVTEGLAAGLEREGRTVITCNDLESAQLIVERLVPSHIVTDVRLTGAFGFEGLDFIRYAKRFTPESRVILMTGDAPEALQLEASERGAVAFLQKPFGIEELNSVLDLLSCSALSSAEITQRVIRMPLLDEILTGTGLHPFFQPVVHLTENYPRVGFEALARYRSNALLRNPEVLFQYAVRKHRVWDLELACISKALSVGAELARFGILFMNIHPDVLTHGKQLRDVMVRDTERFGVDPKRIVLEITEQGSLTNDPSVFESIEALRILGVRFALDDVGIAYSHLPFIDKIRPSFLKISQHFGTGFETDTTKIKIITNLQSLAADFDCELILEGVEHASTATAATEMNIKYGQGFFFGRPADVSEFLISK